MTGYLTSLERQLGLIRLKSKDLLFKRSLLKNVDNPSNVQLKDIELLTTEINKCRKEERFLSRRIKGVKEQ